MKSHRLRYDHAAEASLIELETFRMAHNEKEYLIVVEGTKASQLIEKFQNLIEPAEREAL